MDAVTCLVGVGVALSGWTLKTVHDIAKRLAVIDAAQSEDRARIITLEREVRELELKHAKA